MITDILQTNRNGLNFVNSESCNTDSTLLRTIYKLSGSKVLSTIISSLFFLLPQGDVLLKELNDGFGISELVFLEIVNLVKGGLQRFLCKGTSFLVVLHDLVVEYGEVQGKS